jgi:ABC-type phosphate/phosphonate transport system ATPase subunit
VLEDHANLTARASQFFLLERPTEGSVQVDNQELTALTEKELTRARRQIGMIYFYLRRKRRSRRKFARQGHAG